VSGELDKCQIFQITSRPICGINVSWNDMSISFRILLKLLYSCFILNQPVFLKVA